MKEALTTAPVLLRPDFNKPFILCTDWQPESIAGILSQKDENEKEKVVAYGSHKLSGAEINWSATEGKCYAAVYFTKKYRVDLYRQKWTLVTDHYALKYIMTTKDLTAKWARWALKLRGYDFTIVHRPGKQHTNADGLSRLPRDCMCRRHAGSGTICKNAEAQGTDGRQLLRTIVLHDTTRD